MGFSLIPASTHTLLILSAELEHLLFQAMLARLGDVGSVGVSKGSALLYQIIQEYWPEFQTELASPAKALPGITPWLFIAAYFGLSYARAAAHAARVLVDSRLPAGQAEPVATDSRPWDQRHPGIHLAVLWCDRQIGKD